MTTQAEHVFAINKPKPEVKTTPASKAFSLPVEQDDSTGRVEELIQIAKNGFINGIEGIPDILSMAGQAAIAGGTKAALHASGDSETAKQIALINVEKLPSHVVKKALTDMGVDLRSPDQGDFLGNIVDVISSSLPFVAGGPLLSTIKNKLGFATTELVAAGAGGAARTGAEIAAPDSPGLAAGAEIVASVGTSLAAGTGKKVASIGKDISSAVSEEGVKNRAAKILQSQADDAAAAAEKLDNIDNILGVEPGRMSGDQGLIAISRAEEQADASASLIRQSKVSTRAQQEIANTLGGGGGNEKKFIEQLRHKKLAFERRMRDRMDTVRADIERVISNVGEASPQRQANASINARKLIDDAFTKENNIEKALWDKVDLSTKVSDTNTLKPLVQAVKNIKDKFGHFAEGTSEHFKDIKQIIKLANTDKLTLNDLKQFRTTVGSEIASELGSSTPNKIRISALSEIDDALLDVMEKSGISDEFSSAIAQSRAKNNMFNRGTIGRIRGFDSTGTPKVRPEETLRNIISAEEKGIVGVSDLFIAADSPEMRGVVGDYMLGLFATDVSMRGGINPKSAANFMRKYSGVLDKLPSVKQQIQESINTGVTSRNILDKADDALKLFSAKGANRRALQVMLNHEDPAEALSTIINGKNPLKDMSQLFKAASQDKTGRALGGLKDIIADTVIDKLTTTQTIQGVNLLAGDNVSGKISKKFMSALENSGIYSKQQIGRLQKVIQDIEANAATSQAKIKGGSDTFQNISSSVLSLIGLKYVAPSITKGTKGASIAIASRISKLLQDFGRKIGTDDVNNMVREAILNNPKLLSELLKRPTTLNQAKESIKFFHTYLSSTGTRTIDDEETGEEPR